MNIGRLCQKNAITVLPSNSLNEVAELIRQQRVGYFVVVQPANDEGVCKPIGVITSRDIVVSVVGRTVNTQKLRVEDVMTLDPMIGLATDSIEMVLPKMRKACVRRIPVTGSRGELVGVLSFDNLFDTIADEMRKIVGAIHGERPIERVMRS